MFIQNDHPSILQYAEKLSDLFANKLTSNLLQISLLAHTLEKPQCQHVAYAKISLCIRAIGHLLSLAVYVSKGSTDTLAECKNPDQPSQMRKLICAASLFAHAILWVFLDAVDFPVWQLLYFIKTR